MKCVKQKGASPERVIRVADDVAADLVASGKWTPTSKGAWKRLGRERFED